ncbi:class I SAM-dependent methyltransferase [Leekyejoonella antrihumi]|uniref:Class I SAM-dependent methyltransferase n=1 Tax=Leekyejoonella antrihumi TaxID=1660198 RepID=A0A563DTF4_9MICO|nr:class I SAM-dependent methyltransferase [Leekyejoonella antrihumi]TWP33530.1 class I SAM-dependent methyltransferase [Leekyejoonella antrihumi]
MSICQDESAVQCAYDEVADTYADHFRATEPELPIELAMIEHFSSLLPDPRRVLDAGCGAGRMMPLLDALGCRVDGMDLSPGMVRRAQADHGQFHSQVGSLTALPFPDHAFDGVFSWYSTIHNPDDDLARILREAHRVLRPGGALLLAFQCGEGISDVSEGYRRRGHDITLHRYNRTAEQMSVRLTHTGFDETARLVRRAAAHERSDQAVLIATSTTNDISRHGRIDPSVLSAPASRR